MTILLKGIGSVESSLHTIASPEGLLGKLRIQSLGLKSTPPTALTYVTFPQVSLRSTRGYLPRPHPRPNSNHR